MATRISGRGRPSIYALCDGGDLDTLRRRHQEAIGDDRPGHLAAGIAALLSAGRIVPTTAVEA